MLAKSHEKKQFDQIPNDLKTNYEDPIKEVVKKAVPNAVRRRGAEFCDKIGGTCSEIKGRIPNFPNPIQENSKY